MSVNDETLRLLTDLRVEITNTIDTETRALVRSWARAWDEIAAEWEAAAADIAARRAAGEFVSGSTIRRLQRANLAVVAAHGQIVALVEASAARVTTATGQLLDITTLLDAQMTASQLPTSGTSTATLTTQFARISDEALTAIVERTTQQITSRAWPLADDATEAMLRELIRSIPQGLSPRTAARRMVNAVEGRFAGGLPRALTLARTEIVDAYRTAAYQQQYANRDVLTGWVWITALDERTCPACVAMHGTSHPLEDTGPIGHQNCRCSRMPQTKSWRQLGFDIPEPASTIQTGPDWFARQPAATQLRIMGPERLDALAQGVPFDQLVTRRSTPGWRDSLVPTPARQLVA